MPISQTGLTCRLPVVVVTAGASPISYQGAFLTFPAATFASDPRGGIKTAADGTTLTTTQAPVLSGMSGGPATGLPFYDAAAGRWVPVGAGQSSPDGASYAYVVMGASLDQAATVHVMTVATGADRTFPVSPASVGAQVGIGLLDYDGTGVFLSGEEIENYPYGVYRLDLGTGRVAQMSQVSNVFAVREGVAWVGYVDPHDPNPPTAPASVHFFDSLVAVNLATGARTTWFYRPGVSVELLAIDESGRPIVVVNAGPDFMSVGKEEIRRVNQPLSGGEDNGELVYAGGLTFDGVQPDGDRIWLGSERGIYLYTSAGGLQKVFAFSAAGQTIAPAGFCR